MRSDLQLSSRDGTRVHAVRWEASRPVAQVVLCHGLAEHMGRYDHVAHALNEAGFTVTGVELRGHGHSGGKRGHVEEWRRYTEDLRAACVDVGLPAFIVAHSMGGLVTLDALRKPVGHEVRGVVLSDPLLGETVDAPKVKVWAAGLLAKVLPTVSLSNELKTSSISRDPEVVRKYDADPLVYSTVTPRWFAEMKAAQARVHAHASEYRFPLLMMVGEGDLICSPAVNKDFYGRYGGTEKSLRTFPGLYHEIFNEPEKQQVFDAMVEWLKARV